MTKKFSVVLAATFCALLLVMALFADSAKWNGYLSDVACGSAGMDPSGIDLTVSPEKHTVACMNAASCSASGYGLLIQGKDGRYAFSPFDQKGNVLARAILTKTTKTNGIYLEVTGTMNKDMFSVEAIKEVMSPAPAASVMPLASVAPAASMAPATTVAPVKKY